MPKRTFVATTDAKTMQFARIAGLLLSGVEDGAPQWLGTDREWRSFFSLQQQEDRGEFYPLYPWQLRTLQV